MHVKLCYICSILISVDDTNAYMFTLLFIGMWFLY